MTGIYRLWMVLLWQTCLLLPGLAQKTPGYYYVKLLDKNGGGYTIDHPEAFLSAKAILRRTQQNIPVTQEDLPVSSCYIDSLTSLGLPICCTSKWFNAVTVVSSDTALLDTLSSLDFVVSVEKTKPLIPEKSMKSSKTPQINQAGTENPGYTLKQLSLENGDQLHNLGYRGAGKIIAVIDAGFYHADGLPAFDSLWANNQILGTYDFVARNKEVFNDHVHGMHVLSILGGNIPGELTGSSPEADFWLLRSEETSSEYRIEEDFWTAAAEFADSAGADILSSSLGYFLFDDTTQNYSYPDLNGHTTRVARAATMAAARGMVVVVSAGNEAKTSWQYIISPADAENILAVGAVDSLNNVATFSSPGPTADGRIKPDVCAMGVQNLMQGADGTLVRGNGTSYAAPVISGLAACLWQAFPDASAMEIIDAIKKSGDQSYQPDNIKGYGTPDFLLAFSELDAKYGPSLTTPFLVYPNPFENRLFITLEDPGGKNITVSFYNLSGILLLTKEFYALPSGDHRLVTDDLQSLPDGILILKIKAGNTTYCTKVIKYESF